MSRGNSVPENPDFEALILSHEHFVFSAGDEGLVFKTTHEVDDSAYEVDDSLGGGGLCT